MDSDLGDHDQRTYSKEGQSGEISYKRVRLTGIQYFQAR